MTIFEKSD